MTHTKEYMTEWRNNNREHRKAQNRAYYANNKEAIRAKVRAWYAASDKTKRAAYWKKRKQQARRISLAHYGPEGEASCCRCGVDDIDVLTLDHIANNGAEHRRTDKQVKALSFWVIKNGFPLGFQTLCLNCNYKKHLENVRGR